MLDSSKILNDLKKWSHELGFQDLGVAGLNVKKDFTQLENIEKLIPEHWRPAAVGDAKTCAERWVDQFNAGADGLIIHASTPEQFAPVLAEYEKIRPNQLFAGRSNRPG